jgi:3',5'-cyclic AMP phosphodiesterase CpdA
VSDSSTSQNDSLRFLHFSDLHFPLTKPGWKARDLFNRRSLGWFNYRLGGRRKRFRFAETIFNKLSESFKNQSLDLTIFSGDATTFGLHREFDQVYDRFRRAGWLDRRGIAVPGNHDRYVKDKIQNRFEKAFRPWHQGERLSEEIYPFAINFPGVSMIALDSSTPNRLVMDARGHVDEEQVLRYSNLLKSLPDQPKILVTHYPYRLESGEPETKWRKLRNDDEIYRISLDLGVRLWLHGHRHDNFFIPSSKELPISFACAGSLTQEGRRTYNEYLLAHGTLTIIRKQYDANLGTFHKFAEHSLPFT